MCAKKLLILAVLFAVIASPMTYGITRDIFGPWVASPSGCASGGGVLLHAAVFAGVLYAMWKLSKKSRGEGFKPTKRHMSNRLQKMQTGMGGMHYKMEGMNHGMHEGMNHGMHEGMNYKMEGMKHGMHEGMSYMM